MDCVRLLLGNNHRITVNTLSDKLSDGKINILQLISMNVYKPIKFNEFSSAPFIPERFTIDYLLFCPICKIIIVK